MKTKKPKTNIQRVKENINHIDYEGITEVIIPVSDLLLLRDEIVMLEAKNRELMLDISIVDARFCLV